MVLDRKNNRSTVLTSWRNSEDPAPGLYSLDSDHNSPQLFLTRNLTTTYWRSGAWNAFNFTFAPEISSRSRFFNYSYISDGDVVYFMYESIDSIPSRITIDSLGSLQGLMWLQNSQTWATHFSAPRDRCGSYEMCGAFGVCDNRSSPMCTCLPGFVPRFQRKWDLGEFSTGCKRRNPIACNNTEKFLRVPNIFPADSQSLAVGDEKICEFACSINCSCNAYSFGASGKGCLLWIGDLLDLQNQTDGRDIFLKLNHVEFGNHHHSRKKIILPVTVSLCFALLLAITGFLWLRRKKLKQSDACQKSGDLLSLNVDNNSKQNPDINEKSGKDQKELELPMFSFSSISNATEVFSAANKLGEGGFGPVYKGNLPNGQSVAVKRLAKLSGQGMEELRNEANLIAKLQHKNLVRLLGYCTEKDEKILIYEYMPNKCLSSFLFDPIKKESLNWNRRIKIIDGILQGLLYLHEYSRLRVIHRDLKASNILLDGDLNPKISDFGMARIFGADDVHAKTNRIVGTYGYMSPEYAMEGRFSIKSDVFAFGILLMEILSGRKNTSFRGSDFLSLLGYAWNLWENEMALDLIDPVLEIPSSSSIIALRYIGVCLLCVQENPDDRPTISDVLFMLSSNQATLASPKRPGFIASRSLMSASSDGSEVKSKSINYMTTSAVDPR